MKTALVFTVAQARLGLDISQVEEVLPIVRLVKPPEMPKMLRGFVNVGGALIPVIRLENLLRLNTGSTPWAPEIDLSSTIIVADLSGLKVAWMAGADANILTYPVADTVRLPADHVLNNCAERVIARTPPEPSIVLLDPARLLLESERVRLAELQGREQERVAALADA
jgi:purine-binding chemotaxis protein CheW